MGSRRDRFETLEVVGAGAFGEVHRAHDRVLDRAVALKILKAGPGAGIELDRLRLEARMLANHPHPGIVGVLDMDLDADPPYLVLDWMPGGDLAALLEREGPLPTRRVVKIGVRLARALDHLHSHDVLHRDIKLENVLLDDAGEPALADLGLARPVDEPALTRTGCVVGTPRYMPEEVLAGGGYSPQSDLFALGLLLIELATGERLDGLAASSNRAQDLAQRILDPDLRRVLRTCIRTRASARPASGEAFALDLEASCAVTTSEEALRLGRAADLVPPGGASGRMTRVASSTSAWVRRVRVPGATAALVLAAFLLGGFLEGDPPPPAPAPPPPNPGVSSDTLAEELRPLAEAMARAQGELSPCVVEPRLLKQFLVDSEADTIQHTEAMLAPACLDAWRRFVAATLAWKPVASALLAAAPEHPGTSDLLWAAAPWGGVRYSVFLRSQRRHTGFRSLVDATAAGSQHDLSTRIDERLGDLAQAGFSLTEALAPPGPDADVLDLLLRLELAGEIDPGALRLAELTTELARRVEAGPPPRQRERLARALADAVGRLASTRLIGDAPGECAALPGWIRAAHDALRAPGTSGEGRREGLRFAAREGLRVVARCPPPPGADFRDWAGGRLDELAGLALALGDRGPLEELGALAGTWSLAPRAAEGFRALRDRLDAALAAVPTEPSPAALLPISKPPLPVDDDADRLARTREGLAALEGAATDLAGCAPNYRELHLFESLGELRGWLDAALGEGCLGALHRWHDALPGWLASIREHARRGSLPGREVGRFFRILDNQVSPHLRQVQRYVTPVKVLSGNTIQGLAETRVLAELGLRVSRFIEDEEARWALALTPRAGASASPVDLGLDAELFGVRYRRVSTPTRLARGLIALALLEPDRRVLTELIERVQRLLTCDGGRIGAREALTGEGVVVLLRALLARLRAGDLRKTGGLWHLLDTTTWMARDFPETPALVELLEELLGLAKEGIDASSYRRSVATLVMENKDWWKTDSAPPPALVELHARLAAADEAR